jgi:hypothetical protein
LGAVGDKKQRTRNLWIVFRMWRTKFQYKRKRELNKPNGKVEIPYAFTPFLTSVDAISSGEERKSMAKYFTFPATGSLGTLLLNA